MIKLLKEPLLHFLVIGSLIFAANHLINGASDNDSIVVSLGQQANLANTFERTWKRPPSEAESNALINDFIRQEIAYRESQAMQLDRDDIVIRRRLRQKLEMLAEDVASLSPPTEEEQRAYFAANAEDFRQPAMLSIHQIYFNDEKDAPGVQKAAIDLLQQLLRDDLHVSLDSAGDASLVPRDLNNVRVNELDSMFGSGFAGSLQSIPSGSWGGPVASAFGLHLVRVNSREESRLPVFEAVSKYVLREMLVMRRQEAIDGLYARLSDGYKISIEAPPEILPTPSE